MKIQSRLKVVVNVATLAKLVIAISVLIAVMRLS